MFSSIPKLEFIMIFQVFFYGYIYTQGGRIFSIWLDEIYRAKPILKDTYKLTSSLWRSFFNIRQANSLKILCLDCRILEFTKVFFITTNIIYIPPGRLALHKPCNKENQKNMKLRVSVLSLVVQTLIL